MNEKHIVLIADGDTPTSSRMSAALRRAGYDVVQARSGRETLDMVFIARPDLVILDFMLPVLDGIETARALKASYETRSIPLILLTSAGNRDLERMADADESWWAARLEKPIDRTNLVDTVERAIQIYERQRRTVPERIKDLFVEHSRERVERIAGALRESRTRERVGAGIGSAIEYAAQLKGAALAFGYDKVAAIASEIEERLENGSPATLPSNPDVRRLRMAVSELEETVFESAEVDSVDVEEELASALQLMAGSSTTLQTLRILFVHNDPALAERVQAAAPNHRVRVTFAADTPTAFDHVARRSFDAAVVALGSGDADLEAAAELIRRAPAIPVVVRGGEDTNLYQNAARAGVAQIAAAAADADELLSAACAIRSANAARRNARILVLGGDAEVRRFAREQLNNEFGVVEFEPDDSDVVRDLARHEPDLLIVTLGPDAAETIERLSALRISTSRRLLPIVAVTLPGVTLLRSEIPAGFADAALSLSEARSDLAGVVAQVLDRSRARNEMFRIDTYTGALPREAFLRLVDDELAAGRGDTDTRVTVATLRLDYDRISASCGRDAAENAVAIAAAHLRSSLRTSGEIIGRLGPGCVAAMRRTADEERVRAQTHSALRSAQVGMAFGAVAPPRSDAEIKLGVAACSPAAGVRQAIAESLRSSEIVEAPAAAKHTRIRTTEAAALPRKSYPIQRHATFRRA